VWAVLALAVLVTLIVIGSGSGGDTITSGVVVLAAQPSTGQGAPPPSMVSPRR
jgi:hypothetical protein